MTTNTVQDVSAKAAGSGSGTFEDQAAPALAALVSRVAAQHASAARGELEALRETLASAYRRIDEALGAAPTPDETGLSDCLTSLSIASQARAREELATTIEQHRSDVDALAAELGANKRELAALRDEAARLSAEREVEVTARQEAASALAATTDQLRGVEEQRQRTSALLDASAAKLSSLKEMHAEHERICRDLESQLDAAVAREASVRERAEAAEQECDRLRTAALAAGAGDAAVADSSLLYEQAVAFLEVAVDRLLALYQRFASGRTEEDLLEAVAAAVRTEFSRVVLFKVQPNAFEGVCQDGFGPSMDLSRLAIPRSMDSLLARAAASNEVEMLAGPGLTGADVAPFGGTPTVALALPIEIDGEPVAVLYADDVDQPHRELTSPDLRLKFAELVRQQATPFLTRIAAERRRLAELDEYAAVLLKHLQTTHAADVRSLMPERERQLRLSQNLDYARRLYAQRAQAHGPRAAGLLEQRVASVADAQAASVLGRDLAAMQDGYDRYDRYDRYKERTGDGQLP